MHKPARLMTAPVARPSLSTGLAGQITLGERTGYVITPDDWFPAEITDVPTAGEYVFAEQWLDQTKSLVDKPGGRVNTEDDPGIAIDGGTFAGGDLVMVRPARGAGGSLWELRSAGAASGFSGARVRRTTNQVLTNAVTANVTFDLERFDTDAYHDNATNPERLTVPADGTYLVGASVMFNNHAAGFRVIEILHSGGGTVAIQGHHSTSAANPLPLSCSGLWEASAADHFRVTAHQSSGGNLDVNSAVAEFWITRVR